MQLNDTATLNGIKQDIYYLSHITSSTYSANDINRIVNKYYKILQSDIRAVNEDFFGEIFTYDLSLNTGGTYPNEYNFPTNPAYEKVKQMFIAPNPANTAAPVWPDEFTQVVLAKGDAITDPTYTFSNPTALIYDSSFFLYPKITTAVTDGLKLFAIVAQTDLANDTDKPNIFTDYHDVITWGSLIDIAARLGNDKLFKKATDMFISRRKEMKEYASGRAQLIGDVVEGQNEGGWQFPFGQNSMS
jgi:hypothetical protein